MSATQETDATNPQVPTHQAAGIPKPEGSPQQVDFINIGTGEVTTVIQGTVYPTSAERRGPPSRLDPYIKNPALLIDALKDFEASKPGAKLSDLTSAFRGIDWTSKRDLTGMASESDDTKQAFADGILDVLMYEPKPKLKTTAPINEVKTKFLSGILNDMYAETDPQKTGNKTPEDTFTLLQLQEVLLARALARNPYCTQGKREVAKVVSLFSGKEVCATSNDFFFYSYYDNLRMVTQQDEHKLEKAKLVSDVVQELMKAVPGSANPNIFASVNDKYYRLEMEISKALKGTVTPIKDIEQKSKAQLPFGKIPSSLVERARRSNLSSVERARKALYAKLITINQSEFDLQLPELITHAQDAGMTEADLVRINNRLRPPPKPLDIWWNSVHVFFHPQNIGQMAYKSLEEAAIIKGHSDYIEIGIEGDKRPTHVCLPEGVPNTTAYALELVKRADAEKIPSTRMPFIQRGDAIVAQAVSVNDLTCHINRIESEEVVNEVFPLSTLVASAMEDQTLYGDEYVKIDGYGNRRYEVRRDFDNVYVNMQEWPEFAPVVYELGDDPTIGGLLVRGVIKPGDDGYEILMRPQHNLTVYPGNPPPDIVLKISINDIDNPTGDVLRFADEDVRKCLSEGQRDLLKYVGLRLFENSSQIPDAGQHSVHTSTDSTVARDEADKPKEPRIYKTHIGVRYKSGGLVAQGKPTDHAREQWMRYSTSGRRGRTLDAENEAQLKRYLKQGKNVEDFRYWTIAVGGEEHIDQAALDRLRKSKALTMLSGHYNKHLLRRNPKFA